jgi:hypothetical protein
MLNNELFTEPLVNIDEFIDSPEYLGNYTNNGPMVPPQCREVLHKWFNDDNEVVNYYTADRNTGNSTACAIAMAYQLYRLLSFKNLHATFGFPEDNNIALAFISVSASYAASERPMNCYERFNDMLCSSPWFLKHGTAHETTYHMSEYVPNGMIKIIETSEDTDLLGVQLYSAAYDEQWVDESADEKAVQTQLLITHSNTKARIVSRFTLNGTCYGKQFTAEPLLMGTEE